MIAKIEMQLNCDTVNYRNSSNLQGVIMENIDTGYTYLTPVDEENKHNLYQYFPLLQLDIGRASCMERVCQYV